MPIAIKIPLVAAKVCPICGRTQAYDPTETDAPMGWIKLSIYGFDGFVCSWDCAGVATQRGKARRELFDRQRKEPLLPPDFVI